MNSETRTAVQNPFRLTGLRHPLPEGDVRQQAAETDSTRELKRINIPTLILHGEDDRIVPTGASSRNA
jgi:non-heme chloroperoxidase